MALASGLLGFRIGSKSLSLLDSLEQMLASRSTAARSGVRSSRESRMCVTIVDKDLVFSMGSVDINHDSVFFPSDGGWRCVN